MYLEHQGTPEHVGSEYRSEKTDEAGKEKGREQELMTLFGPLDLVRPEIRVSTFWTFE